MDLPTNYFIEHSIGHSIGKKCHVTVQFAFLNLTVISSVILLVYTEELFLSVYLWTNFTIGLIMSVKPSIKVTYHCIFLAFYFFFSTVISLVNTNGMFPSVFTDEYIDGKVCR